jgi:hypothetical protein
LRPRGLAQVTGSEPAVAVTLVTTIGHAWEPRVDPAGRVCWGC